MAEILHPGAAITGPHAVSENMPTEGAPSDPHAEPYGQIPVPPHVSVGLWQQSWYDPTSQARVSDFVKLPSGSCSLETGKLTGEPFPSHSDGPRGFGQV